MEYKQLSCKCGHNEFNVKGGITLPWWKHELTCRECGDAYNLPVVYVDGIKYNGYNGYNEVAEA